MLTSSEPSLYQPYFLYFPVFLSGLFSFAQIIFNIYKYLDPCLGLSQHSLQPSSWLYRPQAPALRNYLKLAQMNFNWTEITFFLCHKISKVIKINFCPFPTHLVQFIALTQ